MNDLVDSLQLQDSDSLAGWIVDLRNNTGGNMWPMLAGLGALLGDSTVGFFENPDGSMDPWTVVDGASYLNGGVIARASRSVTFRNPRPRVAVLTNKATASSGEAVAIAFKARPNTRFFGIETCGLSTAILGFRLRDASVLGLAVSVMADRTGKPYGGVLVPDEILPAHNDEVLRLAANWILQK